MHNRDKAVTPMELMLRCGPRRGLWPRGRALGGLLGGALGAAALLSAASCTSASPAHLVSGQPVVRVTCGMAVDGITACYRRAGEVCGARGFLIYDWNGRPWTQPYPNPDALQYDPNLPFDGLLIACRA